MGKLQMAMLKLYQFALDFLIGEKMAKKSVKEEVQAKKCAWCGEELGEGDIVTSHDENTEDTHDGDCATEYRNSRGLE